MEISFSYIMMSMCCFTDTTPWAIQFPSTFTSLLTVSKASWSGTTQPIWLSANWKLWKRGWCPRKSSRLQVHRVILGGCSSQRWVFIATQAHLWHRKSEEWISSLWKLYFHINLRWAWLSSLVYILIIEGDTIGCSHLWSTLISYINLSVLTPFCFKKNESLLLLSEGLSNLKVT